MKNDKRVMVLSVIGVVILILLAIGVAYAFFATQLKNDANIDVTTETTGETKVVYTTGENIELTNAEPGDKKEILFNIALTSSNKTDDTVKYGIDWIIESNNFEYESTNPTDAQLTYSLYYSENNSDWIDYAINQDCTQLQGTQNIGEDLVLTTPVNTTKTIYWKMILEYKSYNYNQATNMNKTIKGTLEVTGLK